MSKKSGKQPRPNYKKQKRLQEKAATAVANQESKPVLATVRHHPVNPGNPSQVVSLEPLAPLIIRSGRPFDGQAGVDDARFPPPSTLAGCLRTTWARANAKPFGPELSTVGIRGPLLMRPAGKEGEKPTLLVPKPADAHYFGHGAEARCVRAEPLPFEPGCGTDLPDGLLPLRLREKITGKASTGPAWWAWEDMIGFREGNTPSHEQLSKRGWSPPQGDRRTHVAIDSTTLAADSGRLFQTEGLDFDPDNPWLKTPGDAPTLRLLARCDEPLSSGLAHLGGERRLARVHPESENVWPEPPQDWFERITQSGGLTLTLLTPACFTGGYLPGWLDASLTGVPPQLAGLRLQLVAAALERWQPHSGWDLAAQKPRQTRKLVSAGATYWFRLTDAVSTEALRTLWLTSLCDQEQDRSDGYGLALPAPWTPSNDCVSDL